MGETPAFAVVHEPTGRVAAFGGVAVFGGVATGTFAVLAGRRRWPR
ncbi:hypothetical protein ABT299_00540 [Spirillospora sp. NPDC000708]